jgi:hypothetical protein
MSTRTVRATRRSLTALPAALLLQLGVVAAVHADDLMQQQRILLAGTVTVKAVPASTAVTAAPEDAPGDAQELARRAILGSRSTAPSVASAAGAPRLRGDAQALARNVLLSRGLAAMSGS